MTKETRIKASSSNSILVKQFHLFKRTVVGLEDISAKSTQNLSKNNNY